MTQSANGRPHVISGFEIVFLVAMLLYPLVIAAGLPAGARFAFFADGVLLSAMIAVCPMAKPRPILAVRPEKLTLLFSMKSIVPWQHDILIGLCRRTTW